MDRILGPSQFLLESVRTGGLTESVIRAKAIVFC